jgi:protein SCO1/2
MRNVLWLATILGIAALETIVIRSRAFAAPPLGVRSLLRPASSAVPDPFLLADAGPSMHSPPSTMAPDARGVEITNRRLTEDIGLDQKLNTQVPLDLVFIDEHGHRVRLGDYFHDGQPVILSCVYFRCPMLCTQVLNGVLKSTNAMSLQMDKDYTVVSISIDPRETTEMAAAKKETYAKSYRRPGAEQGWHFLTGDQASIDALTQAVGFRYQYDPRSDQFMHASGIMVLTPDGKLSRYYYGIDYPPRDLRLGLVESSQRRIGTPVDQVLLLCFHYDPLTGRYGLVIERVIRIAGLATLVAMGLFLTRMYVLERRRSAAVAAQVAHETV